MDASLAPQETATQTVVPTSLRIVRAAEVTSRDIRRWEGGRVRRAKDGSELFILEKMVAGKRYSLNLDVEDEDEAVIELRRFKRDPVAYEDAHRPQKVLGLTRTSTWGQETLKALRTARKFRATGVFGRSL